MVMSTRGDRWMARCLRRAVTEWQSAVATRRRDVAHQLFVHCTLAAGQGKYLLTAADTLRPPSTLYCLLTCRPYREPTRQILISF